MSHLNKVLTMFYEYFVHKTFYMFKFVCIFDIIITIFHPKYINIMTPTPYNEPDLNKASVFETDYQVADYNFILFEFNPKLQY